MTHTIRLSTFFAAWEITDHIRGKLQVRRALACLSWEWVSLACVKVLNGG